MLRGSTQSVRSTPDAPEDIIKACTTSLITEIDCLPPAVMENEDGRKAVARTIRKLISMAREAVGTGVSLPHELRLAEAWTLSGSDIWHGLSHLGALLDRNEGHIKSFGAINAGGLSSSDAGEIDFTIPESMDEPPSNKRLVKKSQPPRTKRKHVVHRQMKKAPSIMKMRVAVNSGRFRESGRRSTGATAQTISLNDEVGDSNNNAQNVVDKVSLISSFCENISLYDLLLFSMQATSGRHCVQDNTITSLECSALNVTDPVSTVPFLRIH